MKKSFLSLFALLFISHFAMAQWGSKAVTGNGVVEKESRELPSFESVNVGGGIDLYITQGQSTSVEVEADGNIIPLIKTEVKGNTLRISSENGWKKAKKVRVNVTMVYISEISGSGGSDVHSVGSLKAADLSIKGSGGSDLKLNLQVENLKCVISGGSDAILEGTAGNCKMIASGGSDIRSYELKSQTCDVTTSGASDAYLNVSDKINLSASGASDVYYRGTAQIGSKSLSGSSDLHHQ